MNEQTANEAAEILRPYIGKLLNGVLAVNYVYERELEPMPNGAIALHFSFLEMPTLSFRGNSCGNRIIVGHDEPKPFFMAIQYEFVVRDVTSFCEFGECTNQPLADVDEMIDLEYNEPCGYRLRFCNGIAPMVLNWGDEFHIASEPPMDRRGNGKAALRARSIL